jgi:hypothetical protein
VIVNTIPHGFHPPVIEKRIAARVDRVITGAMARSDYKPQEKQITLQYLNVARTVFHTRTETIESEE